MVGPHSMRPEVNDRRLVQGFDLLSLAAHHYFRLALAARKLIMATRHEFQVTMTCGGCSGAVQRVLGKLQPDKVSNVEIDMEKQRVYVTSSLSSDELLEIIKKTGKETSYIGAA